MQRIRLIQQLAIAWVSMFCFASQADEIKLYTWEGYFSKQLISEFEQATGHKVVQIYFESESLRDDVVYSGKATAYDLFILDGYTAKTLGQRGILSTLGDELDISLDYFSTDSKSACADYGMPYSYGSIGIGYRSSKANGKFDSWMDLFEYIQQFPNKVVIPNHGIDTVGIALLALDYHPLTSSEEELKQAFNLLKGSVDHLLSFRNTLGYAMDKGTSSEMDVAVFYSGEKASISTATGHSDWEYVIPNEGTLLWYECLSSHSNKPMNKATIEFLNFINRPSEAIKNAENIWFATANKEALKLASDEYLNDSELFPDTLYENKQYYYERQNATSLEVRNNIVNVLMEY